jgi:NitT/TauT family transport system ATP-binding protein
LLKKVANDSRPADAPNIGPPSTGLTKPSAVSIQRVSKRFGFETAAMPVLENVTLEIEPGEFVSIVGPSGCGKSTLLDIIAGLQGPTEGYIEILGKRVSGPVHDLGIVFQQHLLLPWRTILENILLRTEIDGGNISAHLDRAKSLLERAGIADFGDFFPDQLSGGMNQRAAICRALIHNPELIVMDEPFGALDAITRDQMTLDFHQLSREEGKSVLFVTHSISEAVFLSNRVVVMSPRPGRIEAIISIDLGRERHLDIRDEPDFATYTRQIRRLFETMGVLKEKARK